MDLLFKLHTLPADKIYELASEALLAKNKKAQGLSLTYFLPYLSPEARLDLLRLGLDKEEDISLLAGFLFPEAYLKLANRILAEKKWPKGLDKHIPFLSLPAVDSLIPAFLPEGKLGDMKVESLLPQASRTVKDNFFKYWLSRDYQKAVSYASFASKEALHEVAMGICHGLYGEENHAAMVSYMNKEDQERVRAYLTDKAVQEKKRK